MKICLTCFSDVCINFERCTSYMLLNGLWVDTARNSMLSYHALLTNSIMSKNIILCVGWMWESCVLLNHEINQKYIFSLYNHCNVLFIKLKNFIIYDELLIIFETSFLNFQKMSFYYVSFVDNAMWPCNICFGEIFCWECCNYPLLFFNQQI